MELAATHPEINYLGIERYTSVLYRAVQKMDLCPLPNLYFVCFDAARITELFAPGEVERIYLNFSDPWPKDRHARRRLTSPDFLARYREIIDGKGRLELRPTIGDSLTIRWRQSKTATSGSWPLSRTICITMRPFVRETS